MLIARLEASAPEIAVELREAGVGKVSIGEVPLTGSTVHVVIDPVTIRVGDLASITVSAPTAHNAADLRKRAQLQAQLSRLLLDAARRRR